MKLTVVTRREKEVLNWAARGKKKAEIAGILLVSESCVKRHCENAFRKLKASNLSHAVAKAMHFKLIKPF